MSVIDGSEITHKWITQLMKLDRDDLMRFDAQREHRLLNDPQWVELIDDIEKLSYFKKTNLVETEVATFGNLKKQHELKQLYSFLGEDAGKSITDFGGGVGNLATENDR